VSQIGIRKMFGFGRKIKDEIMLQEKFA